MMKQVSITIFEFTHTIQQPCGRWDIEFIWYFTALDFRILLGLYWKMWKTVVQACEMLKSLCKRPWGSSKEILLIFFSLQDEGGEKKICQFHSISVDFWNFDWGRDVYHGDEGADTDLMFQFCLPYTRLKETPTMYAPMVSHSIEILDIGKFVMEYGKWICFLFPSQASSHFTVYFNYAMQVFISGYGNFEGLWVRL